MSDKEATPAPGSDEARAIGCTCPVHDNARGKGVWTDTTGRPLYWFASDCPVHCARPA